jgi:hypothetical protein
MTVTGERTWRVTVPQQVRYVAQGAPVIEDGVSLLTIAPVDGRLRVFEHRVVAPFHGENPSMLWAG